MELWSRHSIFIKGNIVLRCLDGILILVLCEKDDLDSPDTLEEVPMIYHMVERESFWEVHQEFTRVIWGWISLCWDVVVRIVKWYNKFKYLSLISIHEFFRSRVKWLWLYVSEFLTWMMNMIWELRIELFNTMKWIKYNDSYVYYWIIWVYNIIENV